MRAPFLKGLFEKIGATLAAAAFAEENEAATARQLVSRRDARRRRRSFPRAAAGARTP